MKVSVDYSYDIKEYGRTTLEVNIEPSTPVIDKELAIEEEVQKYVESIMEEGAVVTNINVESYQEIK